MSSSLLQVFIELGNLHGTSLSVKYSCILLACSEDWTCNFQMIVFLVAQGTNASNRYTMCPAGLILTTGE